MNESVSQCSRSFLTAPLRSAMNVSMSFLVVSLPTLSLMALMATSSGIPQAVNTGEGLLPSCEWQAAPTLAWHLSSKDRTRWPSK